MTAQSIGIQKHVHQVHSVPALPRLFIFVIFTSSSLFFLPNFGAATDENSPGRPCFEIIYGGFIADQFTEQVWYRKLEAYSETQARNDRELNDFRNCNFIRTQLVPLYGGTEIEPSIAGLAVSKPITYSWIGSDLPDIRSKQFDKLNGALDDDVNSRPIANTGVNQLKQKIIRYSRYFQKETEALDVSEVDFDESIYWPSVVAKVFVETFDVELGQRSRHLFAEKFIRDRDSFFSELSSFLQNPLWMSANNCWLIRPYNETSNSRVKWKINYKKDLEIVSLQPSDIDESNRSIDCTVDPGFRYPVFDKQRANVTHLIFSKENKYDNATDVGYDYAAFSDKPNSLHLVLQTGFLANSENEKELGGGLRFLSIAVDPNKKGDTYLDVYRDVDVVRSCAGKIKGWISDIKISHKNDLLTFTANRVHGDDSSNKDLFAVKISDLVSPNYNCNKDVVRVTKNVDYGLGRIISYKMSPDQRTLILVFEIKGRTKAKFFKINALTGVILYEYKHNLHWDGFIHDIVATNWRSNFSDSNTYYLMASKLNMPTSVYLCFKYIEEIVCGDKPHRANTTNLGKKILLGEDFGNDHKIDIYETEIPSAKKRNAPNIHTFVLSSNKNDFRCDQNGNCYSGECNSSGGKAILSIHGGPNEAWNGLFHWREYFLAKLGYTVFLPNPTGSTGYGDAYVQASRRNWGGNIYLDIRDTIDHISKKFDFCQFTVMGFSFGGYMINWLQTRPEEVKKEYFKKIDAFVAINPAYDLRDFAETTDQLWFPQWQLGYSGEECSDHNCDIQYNPALDRDNLSSQNSIPTYFIVGRRDQRIPPCRNAIKMELDYVYKNVPVTVETEGKGKHTFGIIGDNYHAYSIDTWLKAIEGYERSYKQFLNCYIKRDSVFTNCKKPLVVEEACSG